MEKDCMGNSIIAQCNIGQGGRKEGFAVCTYNLSDPGLTKDCDVCKRKDPFLLRNTWVNEILCPDHVKARLREYQRKYNKNDQKKIDRVIEKFDSWLTQRKSSR